MKHTDGINPAQRETVKHGAYIFPIEKYHTAVDQLHPIVPAHWHEESEFTYITRGSCRYHMNLEDVVVEEGDLLFISPLMLHSAALLEPEHDTRCMESDTFVFHLNFLGGNTADICSMRYLTPLQNQELSVPTVFKPTDDCYPQFLSIFQEISNAHENHLPGFELEIKSLLLRLLFLLIQNKRELSSADSSVSPANNEKIRTVLTYIEENFENPLRVEELSGICYFSKYHFMRFFKQHIGMTCVEYINNLRLEKALTLFEQGNTSILDVSLSVGFRNLSYFHRAFLKKYHVTPKTFLNLQRENRTFS